MTDKEQIIVNGVDVNKCFHYEKENKEYTCRLNHTPFHYRLCEDCPNCYFKQLARKTQECEELKKYIQANQPTGICKTCTAKALLENDKYRQSLKEIERICLEDAYTFADGTRIRYDTLDDILSIINKLIGD